MIVVAEAVDTDVKKRIEKIRRKSLPDYMLYVCPHCFAPIMAAKATKCPRCGTKVVFA